MARMPRKTLEKKSLSVAAVMAVAGVTLFAAGAALQIFTASQMWPALIRDCALLILALAAIRMRSLTFWIFFALLLGLEIGIDKPQFAEHLRFLSDIFLRLIKVIVAPLILATLITGIAGHGNLRGVGRIGLKSLIYFEVVTTIALFLGVAAINLSRAGEGLVIAAPSTQTQLTTAAPTARPLRCIGTIFCCTFFRTIS